MITSILRALLAAAALTAATCTTAGTATAAPDEIAPYLGVWNYDQPDRSTMTDVATMDIFGYTATFPQIGTVVFARGAGGEVVGHTDQGCTWRFRVAGPALELASTGQYCFNKIIGSGYNIDRWQVEIDGDHERETLHANSYQPGTALSFQLVDGRRTRAGIAGRAETMRNLLGSWRFDAADPVHLTNIADVNNAAGVPLPVPMTGEISYRAGAGDTVVAHTDDGCDWTLGAHGNTAELAGTQTCGAVTRTFWSVAADGRRQTTIMAGTTGGAPFVLSNGALTRQ